MHPAMTYPFISSGKVCRVAANSSFSSVLTGSAGAAIPRRKPAPRISPHNAPIRSVAAESCVESSTPAGTHTHPAAQISENAPNEIGELNRYGLEEVRQ